MTRSATKEVASVHSNRYFYGLPDQTETLFLFVLVRTDPNTQRAQRFSQSADGAECADKPVPCKIRVT